jgi:hypothetical protein
MDKYSTSAASLFSILALLSLSSPLHANEVMTDRCSKEVAVVPSYNASPGTPGTVFLARNASGNTLWTPPFRVGLDGSGHIRWWCHSTTGNIFDPGTWRLTGGSVAENCTEGASGEWDCSPTGSVSLGSSAQNGWTPERSRCDNHSKLIRARLGPNRLLQIECLGQ